MVKQKQRRRPTPVPFPETADEWRAARGAKDWPVTEPWRSACDALSAALEEIVKLDEDRFDAVFDLLMDEVEPKVKRCSGFDEEGVHRIRFRLHDVRSALRAAVYEGMAVLEELKREGL